jgi:hypothetical protein
MDVYDKNLTCPTKLRIADCLFTGLAWNVLYVLLCVYVYQWHTSKQRTLTLSCLEQKDTSTAYFLLRRDAPAAA